VRRDDDAPGDVEVVFRPALVSSVRLPIRAVVVAELVECDKPAHEEGFLPQSADDTRLGDLQPLGGRD
jgi:hypothetical protein